MRELLINLFKILNDLFKSKEQTVSVAINLPSPLQTISVPAVLDNPSHPVGEEKKHHSIPDRQSNLMSGSEFGKSILNLPPNQWRDDAVYQECLKGNLPNWMRNFVPITIKDNKNELTYFVSPDVLCIGNDNDFLRVCVGGKIARKIVDSFDCVIPTKKMCDQIWRAADLKLSPQPMPPTPAMITTKYLIEHNQLIEKQRDGRNFTLITGHKKDIIYHKYLLTDKSRIAIYGWFSQTGKPIQQAQAKAHHVNFQDYSQSARLISRNMKLNGVQIDFYNLLNDKNYAYLISDEGTYDATTIYK